MYLVFGGIDYEESGGAREYLGKKDNLEDASSFARQFVKKIKDEGVWAHVFDLDREAIVLLVTKEVDEVPDDDWTSRWMLKM